MGKLYEEVLFFSPVTLVAPFRGGNVNISHLLLIIILFLTPIQSPFFAFMGFFFVLMHNPIVECADLLILLCNIH